MRSPGKERTYKTTEADCTKIDGNNTVMRIRFARSQKFTSMKIQS